MSGERILVVEDELALRTALGDALESEGFGVLVAADGAKGLELALREGPDLILLDLMLPELDGFSVLRRLREDRLSSAVMILSARGEEWDRIQGFEVGADDYLVKPFSMRELLLRIRALLKRSEGGTPGMDLDGGRMRIGAATVDFAGYTFERGDERGGLSRMELELLRCFLAREGEALDRLTLLDEVWGPDSDSTPRTVDMHVMKLRKKLEPDASSPAHFVTVHGVGYKFLRHTDLGGR